MPGDASYDLLFAQVRKVHIMSPDYPPILSSAAGRNVLLEKCAAFLNNKWLFAIWCIDIYIFLSLTEIFKYFWATVFNNFIDISPINAKWYAIDTPFLDK